jgi:hypothetical protein
MDQHWSCGMNDRHAATLGAYGTMRFLRRVQGGVEDVEGAIGASQFAAVANMGRSVLLLCLSIRSLAYEAPADLDEESLGFDPFAAVPEQDIVDALDIAAAALELPALDPAAWLQRFQAYVDATESVLGDDKLPLLRSPAGAFALIRVLRRWSPKLEQLGLPPAAPGRWSIQKGDSGFDWTGTTSQTVVSPSS